MAFRLPAFSLWHSDQKVHKLEAMLPPTTDHWQDETSHGCWHPAHRQGVRHWQLNNWNTKHVLTQRSTVVVYKACRWRQIYVSLLNSKSMWKAPKTAGLQEYSSHMWWEVSMWSLSFMVAVTLPNCIFLLISIENGPQIHWYHVCNSDLIALYASLIHLCHIWVLLSHTFIPFHCILIIFFCTLMVSYVCIIILFAYAYVPWSKFHHSVSIT